MTTPYFITNSDMATMVEFVGLALSTVTGIGFAIWRNKLWCAAFALSAAVVIVAVTALADLGS
jgi:hypothetical protein